jgi:hypothetical protein
MNLFVGPAVTHFGDPTMAVRETQFENSFAFSLPQIESGILVLKDFVHTHTIPCEGIVDATAALHELFAEVNGFFVWEYRLENDCAILRKDTPTGEASTFCISGPGGQEIITIRPIVQAVAAKVQDAENLIAIAVGHGRFLEYLTIKHSSGVKEYLYIPRWVARTTSGAPQAQARTQSPPRAALQPARYDPKRVYIETLNNQVNVVRTPTWPGVDKTVPIDFEDLRSHALFVCFDASGNAVAHTHRINCASYVSADLVLFEMFAFFNNTLPYEWCKKQDAIVYSDFGSNVLKYIAGRDNRTKIFNIRGEVQELGARIWKCTEIIGIAVGREGMTSNLVIKRPGLYIEHYSPISCRREPGIPF